MKFNRQRAVLLLGGGLLLMVVLIGLVSVTSSTVSASAQTIKGGGNVPTNCGKTVHYAAYDAPKGSHDFGPNEHFATTADATARFNDKACSDPLFAAIQTETLRHGKDIDAQATMDLARRYEANRKLWARDMKTFNNNVVSMKLANYDTHYETLGMVPGKNSHDLPQLIKSSQQVALGQSLDVKLKNGQTVHERTACDLQYSVPRFPHVPTKPPAPPKHTTPPPPKHTPPPSSCVKPPKPGPGSYTYHPGTCTWTKNRGTFQCEQNATGKGCYNIVHQPVQHEGPGQGAEHQRTPGAPTTAPKSNPTGPAPTSGSPAPDPTKGGYNSGSGNGSGTPGGSTCDQNGCSGGGSQSGSGPTDGSHSGDNNGSNGSGGSTGGGDVGNPFG